jgi:hypothetical protein
MGRHISIKSLPRGFGGISASFVSVSDFWGGDESITRHLEFMKKSCHEMCNSEAGGPFDVGRAV